MADMVCLKGTRVNNIDPRMGRLVFSNGSGVIVLSADNATDIADLEILGDMTVGNCTIQARRSSFPDRFFRSDHHHADLRQAILFLNVQLLTVLCSERKNQWQALTVHQSKREEVGCEFQEYMLTLATEENRKIFDDGMIKDRVEYLNMSVYVRTVNEKTISIKCDRGQNATRIMEIVERKTLIPRDQLYLANQGKMLNDKKTMEESNIETGATIEMSLITLGG